MHVLSDLNLKNSNITLNQMSDFPDNPKIGTLIFKSDGLFIYTKNIFTEEIEWINLLNSYNIGKNSSYIHSQNTESNEWNVTHNLNTKNLFAIIYDTNNVMQTGTEINFISDNEIKLNFASPIKGKAIIFATSTENKLINAGTVISLNSNEQPTIEIIQESDGSATLNFGIPKGKSAYESAVENGFEGTESEWINSINAAKNINIDNKTIIKNENNTISVALNEIIDNNSIILNDDGKIESKSIPFETSLITSWGGAAIPNAGLTATFNSTVNCWQIDLSKSEFTYRSNNKSLFHVEDNMIIINKTGYYMLHSEGSFNTIEYDNLDSTLIFFKINAGTDSPVGMTAATYKFSQSEVNPDYFQLNCPIYCNEGDKLLLCYATASNLQIKTCDIILMKIPVTNEYQVNNASENIYRLDNYSGDPNAVVYGGKFLSNFRKIAFTGSAASNILNDFELTDQVNFTCTKSGYYLLMFEQGVSASNTTTQDASIGLSVNNGLSATTQMLFNNREVNVDRGNINYPVYLNVGDTVSCITEYPDNAVLNLRYALFKAVRLPSVAQTSSNNYQVQNASINIFYHRDIQVTPTNTDVFAPIPIGPAFYDIGPSRVIAEKVSDTQVKILEDGYYLFEGEIGVYDGVDADIAFQLAQNGIAISSSTLNIQPSAINPDLISFSTTRYCVVGDIITLEAQFPAVKTYNILYSALHVTKFPAVAQTSSDGTTTESPYAQIYASANPGSIQAAGNNNVTFIPVTKQDEFGKAQDYFTMTPQGYIKILKDGYYGLHVELSIVPDATTNGKDVRFGVSNTSSSVYNNPFVRSQITVNNAVGNADAGSTFGIRRLLAGTELGIFVSIHGSSSSGMSVNVWNTEITVTHLGASVSDGSETADVSVDNTTITKDDNGVLSALPGGMIDNDSLVLNDEGKITSRSIPFEDGGDWIHIYSVQQGGYSYIYNQINDSVSSYKYRFNANNFYTNYAGNKFGHTDDTGFVFDKDGLYYVSIQHAIREQQANASGDCISSIILINGDDTAEQFTNLMSYSESGRIDHDAANDDIISVAGIFNVKAGQKLLYQFIYKNTTNFKTTELILHINKLPVTNEYQVENPAINVFWNGSPSIIHSSATNENVLLPMGDLVQEQLGYGKIVAEKIDNKSIKILEDGVYHILAEVSFEIQETATDQDIVIYLNSQNIGNFAGTTINLRPVRTNPGRVELLTYRFLKTGDIITIRGMFPYVGDYGLSYTSLIVSKLPSVAQTSGGSADISVDNITITKDENNVLSALPSGLIDNKSLILNEEGKITSKSDNITIAKNENNEFIAKDIAINSNPDDLASERGQIGDLVYPSLPIDTDLNDVLDSGAYGLKLSDTSLWEQKHYPRSSSNCWMFVSKIVTNSQTFRVRQTWMRIGTVGSNDHQIFTRTIRFLDGSFEFGDWVQYITSKQIGDGILNTNGVLSVPEYEGASATESGVAGLVPPATADEKDKFLGGDGLWHEVLGGSSFGEEGVTYIDTNTDVNTLLTPGLYVTRKGMFTNVPGPATQDWGGGSYYMQTFADPAPGILIVTKDGNDILQHLLTKLTACMVIRNITNGTSFGGWYFSAYASSGNRGANGRPNLGLVSPDTETIVTNNMGVLSVRKQGMIASTSDLGMIKADGTTCTIDADGTLHVIFPS